MGILSILGALKTAKDFHDKYKTLCAIHHGETAFQALNQKFDKLSEHIYYAPHLQAVMDTSRTTQQCFQDRKQIHDRLEPIQRTLQSDIISSAVILTPERMQQALAKNPWEVLHDIRPVSFFDLKKLPPEAVPVMFEHENMQYMGWQLRGTLPILFNCDYNNVWLPDNPTRTAPPSTILDADFIVSPGGQYPTINSALSAAKAGDRIVVKTGLYRESIVLNKAIELIASGSPVIESSDECCIEMQTDYAVVRGFTLRCKEYCTVYIPQGSLILEYCDISSEGLYHACVLIYNQNSQGILRHCKIHDSENGPGVFIHENGGSIIEDCDIFSNECSGIVVSKGGNLTVQHCKIHDGGHCGIEVSSNGGCIIEDCDIFAHESSGINVEEGGNLTVRRCKITANKYEAVWIHDNGRGQVENCDLRGNEHGAWNIDETSKVQESGNQI